MTPKRLSNGSSKLRSNNVMLAKALSIEKEKNKELIQHNFSLNKDLVAKNSQLRQMEDERFELLQCITEFEIWAEKISNLFNTGIKMLEERPQIPKLSSTVPPARNNTLTVRPKSGPQTPFSPTRYVKPMVQGFTIENPIINLRRLPNTPQNRRLPDTQQHLNPGENSLNGTPRNFITLTRRGNVHRNDSTNDVLHGSIEDMTMFDNSNPSDVRPLDTAGIFDETSAFSDDADDSPNVNDANGADRNMESEILPELPDILPDRFSTILEESRCSRHDSSCSGTRSSISRPLSERHDELRCENNIKFKPNCNLNRRNLLPKKFDLPAPSRILDMPPMSPDSPNTSNTIFEVIDMDLTCVNWSSNLSHKPIVDIKIEPKTPEEQTSKASTTVNEVMNSKENLPTPNLVQVATDDIKTEAKTPKQKTSKANTRVKKLNSSKENGTRRRTKKTVKTEEKSPKVASPRKRRTRTTVNYKEKPMNIKMRR